MDEINEADTPKRRGLDRLKIVLIGMVGYLLGSFFPAGYVSYLVRSKLFPETIVQSNPVFDRSKLRGAQDATIRDLLDTKDVNPSLFKQRYMDKPVIVTGNIKYFLGSSLAADDITLTLDTGSDYDGIIMTFDDPKEPNVIALRKDGPIRAVCMVSGISQENVHMSHCEVLVTK